MRLTNRMIEDSYEFNNMTLSQFISFIDEKYNEHGLASKLDFTKEAQLEIEEKISDYINCKYSNLDISREFVSELRSFLVEILIYKRRIYK